MLVYTLLHGVVVCFSQKQQFIFITDILFFAIVTVAEFAMLFFLPHNAMRWFYLLGQLLGWMLFQLLFGSKIEGCFRLLQKKMTHRPHSRKNILK